MYKALKNRRRLRLARRQVAATVPQDAEQQRVQLLVLAMMDAMLLLHCQPGMADRFEEAWQGIQLFRRCLDSQPKPTPATAEKGEER